LSTYGRLKLDPSQLKDWQIAEKAEEQMKPITKIAADWGIEYDELLLQGHYVAKIDYTKLLARLSGRKLGKYIDVTAITPTPLGEGKSTTTIGLVQGLGYIGKKVSAAIRQPSGGPTFNIKGSAAGGGLSQCIPLAPFSLGLTGDIDNICNAHNLAMVALTSRLQHEYNYTDEFLATRNLKRLDIDIDAPMLRWVIDFCAQSLRNIIIGIGDRNDGFMIKSGFDIAVSSELMAILAIFKDLPDLRERIGKIVVAKNKKGADITTEDLDVAGAMTAWMLKAASPNLMQTIEGQPVLVHAGPFANIAVGQSSIIADRIGLLLSDYHVTESGFGADIGFEKFWNIKCRLSGLKPDCVVIVATVRALKMHGGGPEVRPGKPLDKAYTEENPELVRLGCSNLLKHIDTVKKAGVSPVVCINSFYTDTQTEIEVIKKAAIDAGARVAVSEHWLKGGEGAVELAHTVAQACSDHNNFNFLYSDTASFKERIGLIAKEVYGAGSVSYSPEALAKVAELERDSLNLKMPVCMVKTHLSLSADPNLKGRPQGFNIPVRDILVYKGAGFVVPVAGDIKLMPGTASDPAFRRIDVDIQTGQVKGLF